MLIWTLTCLLTSSAVTCSLATPGLRLAVSEAIGLWIITYWREDGVSLLLRGLTMGCILSCYDLHPFHQTDFNLFKNRNRELIINLVVYFPIMLIVVKLNVAIKSLQLILSLDFSEDIANIRVYSCVKTWQWRMSSKAAPQNRTACCALDPQGTGQLLQSHLITDLYNKSLYKTKDAKEIFKKVYPPRDWLQ